MIIIVNKEEENKRIDKILTARFSKEHSRTYFQYLIEEGNILVNDKRVKKNLRLKEGDEVKIIFKEPPEITLKAEEIPLNILYEDEYIIVINKPSGMVVHPANGNWSKTLANALLFHCKEIEDGSLRPGIVHRLDKETSGILIAAKRAKAKQKLVDSFAKRRVEKKYLAIVYGKPKEGEVKTFIGRHLIKRKEMAVLPIGKEAISQFKIIKYKEPFSLVEVIISTGRTHQIRVHLKHLKTPLLGDKIYGNKKVNEKFNCDRQFLHASYIKLFHPITDKQIQLIAPIPEDMKRFLFQHNLELVQ